MRYAIAFFLSIFSLSVSAEFCSTIWPQSLTGLATAEPTTNGSITYSGDLTSDTTLSDDQTEYAYLNLNFGGNDELHFEGSGARVLYLNSFVATGNSKINPNNNVDLVIIVAGSMSISGSAEINAVMYTYGSATTSGSADVNGAITGKGSSVDYNGNITYNSEMVEAVGDSGVCEGNVVLSFPYSSGFESSNSEWQVSGEFGIDSPSSGDRVAYEGSFVLDNNINEVSQTGLVADNWAALTSYVPLPSNANAYLTFWYKLDFLDSSDRIYIDVQVEGDDDWDDIGSLTIQSEHTTYTRHELNLEDYRGDNILIRFRQSLNDDTVGSRLFLVDNVKIDLKEIVYYDFPYFNNFDNETSSVTVNGDESDDINGRDHWNHQGDWTISGTEDLSSSPTREAYDGSWYLNNNSEFDEDQAFHFTNQIVEMNGYIAIPSDAEDVYLTFKYKLDFVSFFDYVILEYQIAGSDSWTFFKFFNAFEETSEYAVYRNENLSSLKGSAVKFRFRQLFTSFSSGPRTFLVDGFGVGTDGEETELYVLIEHSGNGAACIDHTVTLKLCANDDCSELYTGSDIDLTLQKESSGSTTDIGTYTIPSDSGQLEVSFSDTNVGTFDFSAEASGITDIRCLDTSNSTTSCSYEINASGFAVISGNNTASYSCASTSFTIQALSLSGDSDSNACVPAFESGDYPLSFSFNFVSTDNTGGTEQAEVSGENLTAGVTSNTVNVSFDSEAKAVIPVAYNEAGQISITTNDTSGVLSSATANLKFVPPELALQWQDDSSDNKAAVAENIVISAQCSSDPTEELVNYEPSGTYAVDVNRISPTDAEIIAQGVSDPSMLESFTAGGTAIAMGDGAVAVSGSAGSSTLAINYDNAASIEINVSDTNYLSQTDLVPSGSISATYTPTHYVASDNSPQLANSCSVYSYLGEALSWADGQEPVLSLTATNAVGEATEFAELSWAYDIDNMAVEMVSNVYEEQNEDYSGTLSADINVGLTMGGDADLDGTRTYQISGPNLVYAKPVTVINPFTSDVTLTIPAAALTDENGTGVKASYDPDDLTYVDYAVEDIGGSSNRYGRLKIDNAFGSELDPLSMYITLQYFDGTNWVTNSDDVCTSLSEGLFTIDGVSEFYDEDDFDSGNGDGYSLEPDNTALTHLTINDGDTSVTSSSGIITLPFAATGDGNVGEITVELDLSSFDWLNYDWDQNGTIDSVDTLLTGTLVFGRYRGNDRVIFKRERSLFNN